MTTLASQSVACHLRSSRYAQRERPAITIPNRLRKSRFGNDSAWRPAWAGANYEGAGVTFEMQTA